MRLILSLLVLFISLGWSTAGIACGPQVHLQFVEESPDQFRIDFVRGPKLRLVSLKIDLTNSAAGAIFDDYNALGVQGPQPNAQGVAIRSIDYRTDGKETVTVVFKGFTEKRRTTLHSDLDDNGRAADKDENHLYEGELTHAHATATLISENGRQIQIDGAFDKQNVARLGSRACV